MRFRPVRKPASAASPPGCKGRAGCSEKSAPASKGPFRRPALPAAESPGFCRASAPAHAAVPGQKYYRIRLLHIVKYRLVRALVVFHFPFQRRPACILPVPGRPAACFAGGPSFAYDKSRVYFLRRADGRFFAQEGSHRRRQGLKPQAAQGSSHFSLTISAHHAESPHGGPNGRHGGFSILCIQNCGAKPLCAAGRDALPAAVREIPAPCPL